MTFLRMTASALRGDMGLRRGASPGLVCVAVVGLTVAGGCGKTEPSTPATQPGSSVAGAPDPDLADPQAQALLKNALELLQRGIEGGSLSTHLVAAALDQHLRVMMQVPPEKLPPRLRAAVGQMKMLADSVLSTSDPKIDLALRQLNQYAARTVTSGHYPLAPEIAKILPEFLHEVAASVRFNLDDMLHIMRCFVYRQLANQIVKDVTPHLRRPLGQELADAVFDWTVRNVQLVPDPPSRPGDRVSVTPFEVLLHGRGTAYERVWVFAELLRQLDMPTFLIRCWRPDDKGDLVPVDWVGGVLVGQEIYLYDQRLGIRVPGPDGARRATLREARTDPAVLEQLDMPGRFPYDVRAADLQRVEIWLPNEIRFWWPRMKRLQEQLAGQFRVVLHEDVKATSDRILAAVPKGAAKVLLAPLPPVTMNTAAYSALSLARFCRNQRLLSARLSQLMGRLDQAVLLYPRCRTRDDGAPPRPSELAAFEEAKQFATYWLALCKIDQGDTDTALWWLRDQYLTAYPNGAWANEARLAVAQILEQRLRGRASDDPEAIRQLQDQARQILKLYDVPTDMREKDHGNAIRSRRLRRRVGLPPAPASQPATQPR